MTFNTTGMQPTDLFVVEGKTLSLDTTLFGGASSAYRGGELHLETGGGVLTPKVHVKVPMTQNEFNIFLSNQGTYLNGDTFTFPCEIVCFGRGTLILTDCGDVAVEDLREGDLVMTRDHGAQPIRWIGSHCMGAVILYAQPHLRPIRISADALGQNAPAQDLIVSPQHRVLVRSKIAQRMFGATEILVAAKHLLELDGVNIADDLAEAGGKTIVNTIIPFRGLVREISGAAPAERRLAAAIDAGFARRGFLRGTALARRCPGSKN